MYDGGSGLRLNVDHDLRILLAGWCLMLGFGQSHHDSTSDLLQSRLSMTYELNSLFHHFYFN